METVDSEIDFPSAVKFAQALNYHDEREPRLKPVKSQSFKFDRLRKFFFFFLYETRIVLKILKIEMKINQLQQISKRREFQRKFSFSVYLYVFQSYTFQSLYVSRSYAFLTW